MIGQRSDSLISPLTCGRIICAGLLLAVVGGGGCLAPALAPLVLQAGEMAGAGAINAADYAAGGNPRLDGTMDPGEKEERCDELELQVPGTIELQVADDSPTAWRELQLGGSSDAPQWQAVIGQQSDAAGWRPVANLHTMSFAPPLQQGLRGGKHHYLAYAPAEPRTATERDQLVALTADFGAGLGTFQWNGRVYQYTLVNRLPCFPGPVVVAGQTRG